MLQSTVLSHRAMQCLLSFGMLGGQSFVICNLDTRRNAEAPFLWQEFIMLVPRIPPLVLSNFVLYAVYTESNMICSTHLSKKQ